MRQRKPSVKTRCPANYYAADTERIIEFSAVINGQLIGGLISFRVTRRDTLLVDVYRTDPGVEVIGPDTHTPPA